MNVNELGKRLKSRGRVQLLFFSLVFHFASILKAIENREIQ
jgi:hypothetical protein